MGRLLLCTPSQLWTNLLNRYRMTPKDFDPGLVSDVAHTGTGTGQVRVTDLPYDAYFAELRVERSGDTIPKIGMVTAVATGSGRIDVTGMPKGTYQVRVQIVAAGWFRYSLDNGATYSVPIAIPSPSVGDYAPPGTGMVWTFIPGNSGFAVGDLHTFSTVGAAQVRATIYNVSTPLEPMGTGTISISGQAPAGRAFTISLCIAGPGGIGEATWIYSINGGKPVGPTPIPSSFTIPCLDVTINFDAGCGPTYFGCGAQWIISTRGSQLIDLGDHVSKAGALQPIKLERPEQTGLRLVFEPIGAASPAFVATDLYTFSTSAPPDLLEALYNASDEALAKLRARYMNQIILAWDGSVVNNVARIARGTLYDRKGENWKEDRQTIQKASMDAHAFFTRVGSKLEHPLIIATPLPGILAPRVVLGPDPTGIGAGPFGSEESSFIITRITNPYY